MTKRYISLFKNRGKYMCHPKTKRKQYPTGILKVYRLFLAAVSFEYIEKCPNPSERTDSKLNAAGAVLAHAVTAPVEDELVKQKIGDVAKYIKEMAAMMDLNRQKVPDPRNRWGEHPFGGFVREKGERTLYHWLKDTANDPKASLKN